MQSDSTDGHLLKKRFWFFILFAVIAYLLMRYMSGQLTGKAIIEFEMAKTVSAAQAMINSWGEQGINQLLRSTYIDFVFIIGYVGVLFYGCRFFGRLSDNYLLQKAGRIFSYLAILAGLLDCAENLCMIYTLKLQAVAWVVHFTYDLAVIKFSLVFIMILFILVGLLFWVIDRLSHRSKWASIS